MGREAVESHYREFWGKPSDRRRFNLSPIKRPGVDSQIEGFPESVEVLSFRFKDVGGELFWQVATSGMSDYPMSDGGRVELILTHRAELDVSKRKALSTWMARMVSYPFAHDVSMAWGHVLRTTGLPKEISPMTSALIQIPFFEKNGFELLNSEDIRILWVVPIHEKERDVAIERSVEELEQMFAEKNVDFLDLQRPSVLLLDQM